MSFDERDERIIQVVEDINKEFNSSLYVSGIACPVSVAGDIDGNVFSFRARWSSGHMIIGSDENPIYTNSWDCEGSWMMPDELREILTQGLVEYRRKVNGETYEDIREQRDRYAKCLFEIMSARMTSGGTSAFTIFVDSIIEEYVTKEDLATWFKNSSHQ